MQRVACERGSRWRGARYRTAVASFSRFERLTNLKPRLPGYVADHWCVKGHILLCIEGELHTELEDGRKFTLTAGMSYQVSDNAEPHRSRTDVGARLFIVD